MSSLHLARGGVSLAHAVQGLYRDGQTDYGLEPLVRTDAQGSPVGRIRDGDVVIFCCRRGEREIQLTEAFAEQGFIKFSRRYLDNVIFVTLTLYHEKFKHLPVAFAPTQIPDTLGEIVSRAGRRQLRVAESEKFAHVTFFFNGCTHQPFVGEEDVQIPSPRGVPFDQVPELSLHQVAQRVVRGVAEGFDLIVANFANGDVIGHTANRAAKIRCAELVDSQLGTVVNAALAYDYAVLVTADHGNLEEMEHGDGTPHVSHTTNPVPFLLIDPRRSSHSDLCAGKLADITPTILQGLGIVKSCAMNGRTLAPDYDWGGPRHILLVILDGWGIGKPDETNPIWLAPTPAWDEFIRQYPNTQLQAAGESVGLRPGRTGNSEAGHMNIGAGRVVLQDDVRLDVAMRDGSFHKNEILCHAIDQAKRRKALLHLIGLLTEKSSHGSIEYPLALLRMAKANGLSEVYVHLIFDGRSTAPGSAPALLERLERQRQEIGVGQIVTGMGRAVALDRDGNYSRTRSAYEALVLGAGRHYVAE